MGVSLFVILVVSASSGYVSHQRRVPEQRTGKHMEKESEKGYEMHPLQSIEVITHEDFISPSKSAVIAWSFLL